MRLPRFKRRESRRDGFKWIALVVTTLAIGFGLSWYFWEDLRGEDDSLSTTINNLSLVVGGIVAIELAVWRSIVGERQTTVAQRQVETAQSGLLNERFQKGAEMLGSEDLSVRLGGIYALQHLAAEHPKQYHVQVMKLLCAFVRHPTKDKGGDANLNEEEQSPRPDVSAVAEIICKRDDSHLLLERNLEFMLDLRGADLRHLNLSNADLSGANLREAKLSNAFLKMANLSNAQLAGASFSNMRPRLRKKSHTAYLEAGTSYAYLSQANISGALFSLSGWHPALGLGQTKLNEACADPNNIPKLEGVVDAETGKRMVWHGKSCEDE